MEINELAVDLDTAVDGVQTFGGDKTFNGDVTFSSDVTFQAQTFWGDGDQAVFGDDSDFKIYYDGNAGVQTSFIDSDALQIRSATDTSELYATFLKDGPVELYYDGTKRFGTSATGASVIGDLDVGGDLDLNGDLDVQDFVTLCSTSGNVVLGSLANPNANISIYAGTSPGTTNYFQLRASSNEAYITNTSGSGSGGGMNISARTTLGLYSGGTGGQYITFIGDSNGAANLYYQSLKKLETTTSGVSITGTASATGFSGPLTGNADTATALETARNIAGQSFDGTADITIAATDLSDTDQALATTSDVTFNSITKSGGLSTEFLKADGTVDSSTYLTSYTETDPVVSAINGIVKSNGTTISAAVAGTDYVASVGSESYTKFGTSTSPNPGIASTAVGNYILNEAQTSDIETSFTMTSGYTKALITLNAMLWNVTDGNTETLVEIERSVAGGAYSKIGTFVFPVANTFYGAMNFTLLDTHGATAGDTVSYKLKNGNSVANGYSDESIRLVTGACGDTFGVREIA